MFLWKCELFCVHCSGALFQNNAHMMHKQYTKNAQTMYIVHCLHIIARAIKWREAGSTSTQNLINFLHTFFAFFRNGREVTTILGKVKKVVQKRIAFLEFFTQGFLITAGDRSSCQNFCVFGKIRTQTLFLGSPRGVAVEGVHSLIKRC